jgi:hypothetical protein
MVAPAAASQAQGATEVCRAVASEAISVPQRANLKRERTCSLPPNQVLTLMHAAGH